MDEVALVIRSQQGDVEAFSALVELYSARAFRTAYLISGSKDTAEDVLQEAFIQCYRRIHRLRSPESFGAWFYQLLTRLSWRLAARERRAVPVEDIGAAGAVEPSNSTDDGAARLETEESKELIRAALKKLSVPLRTTVVLRYYNDLPLKEIARVLRCPEGTVKSRLSKALRQLACELGELDQQAFPSAKLEGKNRANQRKGCETREAGTV